MADPRKREIQFLVRELREASPLKSVELARKLHRLVEAQRSAALDEHPTTPSPNKKVAAAAG